MEDNITEGPSAVWHMFNAPTMVLFNNLEQAADGLERIINSILKLTGDFSEVLVPRPGSSSYPETHFQAFNTWLIGRLVYVLSVKELTGIHNQSKEAQIKILNVLAVNQASFHEKILFEYIDILHNLVQYYKTNANQPNPQKIVIKNFASENVEVQNVQLNFEPIFVNISNIENCEGIIGFTLQILSETIPIKTVEESKNKNLLKNLFHEVILILEQYNMKLKLVALKFFCDIIDLIEKVTVINFADYFCEEFNALILLCEALTSTLALCYEKGEICMEFIENYSTLMIRILKLLKHTNDLKYKDVLLSISSIILDEKNSKIFNKNLKHEAMKNTSLVNFPKDVLKLESKDFIEIEILSEYFESQMLKEYEQNKIQNSWYYQQLKSVLENLEIFDNSNIDVLVLTNNLKRFSTVLNTFLSITITQDGFKSILKKDLFQNESQILKKFEKISTKYKEVILTCIENTEVVLNILITIAYLKQDIKVIIENTMIQNIIFQSKSSLNNKEVKVIVVKYVLAGHIMMKMDLTKTWMTKVQEIITILTKNKNDECYKMIIALTPYLLHSKVMFQSKIIADILMPAFLTKNAILQTEVTKILPLLTCLSFGDYSIALNSKKNNGNALLSNENWCMAIYCKTCHKNEIKNISNILEERYSVINDSTTGQRSLFVKFLNIKTYADINKDDFTEIVNRFSSHTVFDASSSQSLFCGSNCGVVLKAVPIFIENIWADKNLDDTLKETMLNTSLNILVTSTRKSLETNDWAQQSETLDIIKKCGLLPIKNVLLPTTKLLVYFIMHPQCSLGPKALIYLREICEKHKSTPNQIYHRYKKDFCKLFVDCSLHNGKDFAVALLKVVRAFGFVGYRDFISKDVHHFLPFLITYCGKLKEVPGIIEEIASLIQCSVADFITERFPHVYTYVYIYQSEQTSKKCYELIEKMSNTSILDLIKRHFRVILTEFLLQYCCNPEKVLNACKYLACHDPDVSTPNGNMNMTTSQIADFLNPKFLGVLAYFDHKLVNAKVALSVKRKALQSFPDIMKIMGSKYLTPLRFKVLATLRSALILAEEFPKIVAAAWSAFIHNIDTMCLGPLLSNLAVSLLQQFYHAPHEINKIFQYLVLNNENLLSSHISDLFFVEETKISEKIKAVVRKHVKRTQPENFLDKINWYLHHMNQDIGMIKAFGFRKIDELLKNNRAELHKAIFGGKNIDPVIVELIDRILSGCKDPDPLVHISSGSCLGQFGAIDPGRLPRQYVQTDRTQFAFTLNDDCFAATALQDLCTAFQYEKDTMNMDCYALTIQEMLKIYNISPMGAKKDVWDSFPEHLHQIMYPLLSSRYTLAYPSQPKKTHPLFGSVHASNFLEWAHNWAGQLISLISSESIRELLRTVHPSMRRDVRTLLLFLPYVLLHAVMSNANVHYVYEEIMAVIGLENFEAHKRSSTDHSNKYKLLRHIRLTPCVASVQTDDGIQVKCSKMVYTLFDFLNRWLLEWCHSKQHPLQNENYKAISLFVNKFDKLTIARGNFACGEFERALQYLEMYIEEDRDRLQPGLAFLQQIYAQLQQTDNVAGILSLKRSEPSLSELILTQVVTGRVEDAALCYQRLAQQGPLDLHSLQGMVEVYLSLDDPASAMRILEEMSSDVDVEVSQLFAEPFLRLGRFDQLKELVDNTPPSSVGSWGLISGGLVTAYRTPQFPLHYERGVGSLLSCLRGGGDSTLRGDYQTVLGLHILTEATHVHDMFTCLKSYTDGDSQSESVISSLLCDWRRRLCLVTSDVRTVEPILRMRRTYLMLTQELLQPTHPLNADKIKSCIGDLWIQSAKFARKAEKYQQSYKYILSAEEYSPPNLFVGKCKLYWGRGQRDLAFTTLRRGLGELERRGGRSDELRKISASAKLLIAKYNDETTNVDVDVNIGYYKDAVDSYKQWEKSLVCLGAYYEKVSGDSPGNINWSRRVYALNTYGKALLYGHKYLYQSMPRMLSIWLDVEVTSSDTNLQNILAQMTDIIKTYSEKLPLYLYLTAFSQIVSRICHPVKDVYLQLKAIIVKLILAYPQHTLWNMMSVIKSGYPQRQKRCQEVFSDPRLKEPHILKLVSDFTQLAEKLIELCNKPIVGNSSSTTVSSLVRTLPRLLESPTFSHILMPFEQYCKVDLPSNTGPDRIQVNIPTDPPVYIAGIEETVHILPSLQKPRKVTLKGSDGKSYIIMLKPRDDLRKDYRLMEFNAVVNRFLAETPSSRGLYIRTYCVLPLNEECGLIEWVPRLLGLRPILMHIYKQRGIHTSNRELKEMMCSNKDPVEKKRRIYEEQLLPRHPPVFQEWFRRVFSDPSGWYQARSAYIRTTAVMSMVGYILGLGDRHGENISFDSMNGDTVHVDFNCLFNKGESFEWPERVPFRLTHNMEAAMGPLGHEGMFRKSCEVVMRVLRSQSVPLMSVTGPFLYDPLVSWGTGRNRTDSERTNDQATVHLRHIHQRLRGMVKTKNKQLSLSLSPEGQVEHLIVEATSVLNLCQMYIGWGPFL